MSALNDFISDPDRVKAVASVVDLSLKLILGIIGLYLAHSIGRHVALRISEKRLAAYSALWQATKIASPTRLRGYGKSPLTPTERESLHDELQKWYYESGNGMLLTKATRTMFLKVKDNLILPPEKLEPPGFASEVQQADSKDPENNSEAIRGERSIRQLSLLRTRMKADFRLFGIAYGGDLTARDKEFLRDCCGERLWKKPWRNWF